MEIEKENRNELTKIKMNNSTSSKNTVTVSYNAVKHIAKLKKRGGVYLQKPKEKLTYLFLLPKHEWTPHVNKQHKHWKVHLNVLAPISVFLPGPHWSHRCRWVSSLKESPYPCPEEPYKVCLRKGFLPRVHNYF